MYLNLFNINEGLYLKTYMKINAKPQFDIYNAKYIFHNTDLKNCFKYIDGKSLLIDYVKIFLYNSWKHLLSFLKRLFTISQFFILKFLVKYIFLQ